MEKNDNKFDDLRQEKIISQSGDLQTDSVDIPLEVDSSGQELGENRKLSGVLKTLLIIMATIALVFFTIFFVLYLTPLLSEINKGHKIQITGNKELRQSAAYKKQVNQLTKDIQVLSRKYSAYTSGQSYIVINTTDNRFLLYRNKKLIREGFCSSGSYTMLQTEGNKRWIFKTPKGKYWIHGKTTNPVWKKPDWAFVEEGLPIPSENDNSRFEYGVLGDYAMTIGDGYMIHGTIYKRFLGMPVTHGCVRLNDEDLEVIYNTLSIGSKVYIF
jgi:lipoprotein-anchoring transpeptidase ErfK/SrfK